MVRTVRETGGSECWVLNKHYLEIYHFKGTQISDFDVQIDLNNALEQEHVFTGIFVLHMKDHILSLLDEVPGKVYLKKIECYRELYDTLNKKFTKTKILRIKNELAEKIEFIEEEFPQFIIWGNSLRLIQFYIVCLQHYYHIHDNQHYLNYLNLVHRLIFQYYHLNHQLHHHH